MIRLALILAAALAWSWWRSDGKPPFPVAVAILTWHMRRGRRRVAA